MGLVIKSFEELTKIELYEILKVRVNIFVVEQKCPYPEIDGIDYKSLHMFYKSDKNILAYLRMFEKEKGTIQIGRVLTAERGKGLGGKILKETVSLIKKQMKPEKIYLEAQCYLLDFMKKKALRYVKKNFLKMEFHTLK